MLFPLLKGTLSLGGFYRIGHREGECEDLRESWHLSRVKPPVETWKEEQLEPLASFRPRKCLEIWGERRQEVDVDVAVEESVNIILNGAALCVLTASPYQQRELAIGFLVAEGLVESFSDFLSVRQEDGNIICESRERQADRRTGCSACSDDGNLSHDLKPIRSDMRMKASDVLRAAASLNDHAKVWRRTGATHASIVCSKDGSILTACEDISRSSSVDKAVGAALIAGEDLSSCALITSGRLSGVMVAKAARSGFPVLISKGAPMDSGVELADRIGMTLVGFARSPKMYIYSGAERIA
jgi:FdhD protein